MSLHVESKENLRYQSSGAVHIIVIIIVITIIIIIKNAGYMAWIAKQARLLANVP